MSKRFIGSRQTTIGREIELSGTGVHSGAPVSMVLHPAEADTGYRFLVSKRGRIISEIPADVRYVKNLTLCTVLGDDSGVTVGTVEHLLAALRGLSIDNCYIEIDAREVPIMDGSAAAFVEAIDEVGIRELSQPRKFIKVLKPVRVAGRRLLGRADAAFRLPPGRRDRFPDAADRPAAPGAGNERRRVPQRDLRGPARSASCATWRTSGRPAWRSAPRSTTPSPWPTTAS